MHGLILACISECGMQLVTVAYMNDCGMHWLIVTAVVA